MNRIAFTPVVMGLPLHVWFMNKYSYKYIQREEEAESLSATSWVRVLSCGVEML